MGNFYFFKIFIFGALGKVLSMVLLDILETLRHCQGYTISTYFNYFLIIVLSRRVFLWVIFIFSKFSFLEPSKRLYVGTTDIFWKLCDTAKVTPFQLILTTHLLISLRVFFIFSKFSFLEPRKRL